jgi:hypothetical protein
MEVPLTVYYKTPRRNRQFMEMECANGDAEGNACPRTVSGGTIKELK